MITYELSILIGTVILVFYGVYALTLKRDIKRTVVTCVFIFYLTGVAVVTLFPIVYDDLVEYTDTIMWYNFIPFKTVLKSFEYGITVSAIIQIIGNIILSIPFGVIVLLLFEISQWWKKLLIALSFAVIIELSQLLIGLVIGNMYRNVDIDDIILNTLGVYLGYFIYAIIPEKIKHLIHYKTKK